MRRCGPGVNIRAKRASQRGRESMTFAGAASVADETREVCGERAAQETTARIAKIRARIEAGDYVVDLDELAEGFVVDEVLRARGLR